MYLLPLIAVIIMLVALWPFYKKKAAPFAIDPSILTLNKIYQRRLDEMDDIDNVLKRPIAPGNEGINNLILLPDETNNGPAKFIQKAQEKLGSVPKEVKLRMKPGTKIISNNEGFFYWDIAYSTEPTPFAFAINPKKYIRDHPDSFPSYEIYKNNHYFMEKEQRIPL